MNARRIIEHLGLSPLPAEGGWFRPTWRSAGGSAIYFLLTRTEFSALHRLDRDELWHFHAGHPIEHVQLDPATGTLRTARMGPEVVAGDQPQIVVPAGSWQGARLAPEVASPHDFALTSCTLTPPWDERGFTLGQRGELTRQFPRHRAWIEALTR